MIRFSRLTALALLVLIVAGGTDPLHAQTSSPQIVPLSHVATPAPAGDGLDVKVYFTVKGSDDLVLPRNQIDFDPAATAALVPDRGGLAPATVGPPNTPIRIALLLDASGSIGAELMKKVRSAAQAAVRAAPEGAEIAVYRFSRVEYDGPFNPVEDFNTNRDVLINAIQGIPDPKANDPTCLYNAAYLALAELAEKSVGPQDRSALIIFTDGVDDDGTRTGNEIRPCSRRQPDDVVLKATDSRTTIHTIGLCKATCGNIDSAVLRDLAVRTNGATASGGEDQLSELFGRTMERLKSQWMLSTKLLARLGDNQVLFTLITREGEKISFTLNVQSPQDYQPPPTAQLVLKYDQQSNSYNALLTVENAATLKNLVFQVWSDAGNQQLGPIVEEQPINLETLPKDASGRLIITQSALKLRAQKSYCFVLRAQNAPAPLASSCAVHDVQPGISIVKKPAPDETNTRMPVSVQVIGVGDRPLVAEWQILAKSAVVDSGSQALSPQPDGSADLVIPLPAAVRSEREPREYELRLVLRLDGQTFNTADTFSVAPLRGQDYTLPIALGVALVVAIVAVILLLRRGPPQHSGPLPAPARGAGAPNPFNEPTGRLGSPKGSAAAAPRVVVRIVNSPDEKMIGQRFHVEQFPCVIGRSRDKTRAQVSIPGDAKISLEHLKLSESGGVISVEDMGSTNGTFRDGQRIEKGVPIRLGSAIKLQLAQHTEIELTIKP